MGTLHQSQMIELAILHAFKCQPFPVLERMGTSVFNGHTGVNQDIVCTYRSRIVVYFSWAPRQLWLEVGTTRCLHCLQCLQCSEDRESATATKPAPSCPAARRHSGLGRVDVCAMWAWSARAMGNLMVRAVQSADSKLETERILSNRRLSDVVQRTALVLPSVVNLTSTWYAEGNRFPDDRC